MATLSVRSPLLWDAQPMPGPPGPWPSSAPQLGVPGKWAPPVANAKEAAAPRTPAAPREWVRRKMACERCRGRKKKCNLAEPKCKSCERTGNVCTYNERPQRKAKRVEVKPQERGKEASRNAGNAGTAVNGATGGADGRALQKPAGNTAAPRLKALYAVSDAGAARGDAKAAIPSPLLVPDVERPPTASGSSVSESWQADFPFELMYPAAAEAVPGASGGLIAAPIPRTPALLPALPADSDVVFAVIDRFFLWSDELLPTIHRGRFYENWPPSPLLLSTILLVTPLFDPASQELVASTCSRRSWNQGLFSRVKASLPAALDLWASASDPAMDIAATFLLGVWSGFSGLGQLLQGFYGLTRHLIHRAGWETSPASPAPTFRQLAARRFGPQILTAPLTPPEVAFLRNMWIDLCQQHRIMSIVSVAEQTRRDWARALDSPPGTGDFDAAYRPAPPGIAEWEASFDPSFDPRRLPETPLISDAIGWIDRPAGHPDRERALENLAYYLTSVRGTVPWLAGKFRALVDGFLWACRAAGLHSPAQLPPAAPEPPAWLSRPSLQRLLAMREHADAALLAFRRALPAAIGRAWASGSAAEAVLAFLGPGASEHHFQYAFNVAAHLPGIFLLRAELYTSIGTCLSRGPSTSTELAPGSLEVLADEFAVPAEPFASLLEDAILCTRFHAGHLGIEPRLARAAGTGTPTVLRCAILHTAFCQRFRAAGVAPGVLEQVAGDARDALRVLEAFAGRHGGFMGSAYALAKKLWEDGIPSEFEVEAVRLGVDLEPGEEDGGGALRADPALAKLLDAYAGRKGGISA